MDNNDDNTGFIPRIRNVVRNVLHTQNSSESTSAPPATNTQAGAQSDSDDSMPDLQSVSDSSDEEMDEDEHQSEDEVVPLLVPTGNPPSRRRARSEEDVDGELRDRRNPTERTGNDHRTQSRPQPPDPPPQATNTPPDNDRQRQRRVPRPLNLLSLLFPLGGNAPNNDNNANANDNNNNNNPNPNPQRPQGIFGGIAISIPGPNGTTVTHPIPLPEGANPFQFFLGGGNPDANNGPGLGDFMARFHEFLNASLAETNREDPERAKRLVEALEPVPIGLVKRLERVGDVGGGDDRGTGGDSVCAICWDSLLGGDVDAWNKPQPTDKPTMDVDPASIPLPESGTSTPLAEAPPAKPAENKIVSMPCAHVFHASCLVPWFTRPNQTTCPTCRFNIDPEELTRSPPRPIHSQDSASARPAGNPNQAPQPQAAEGDPHVHVHMNDHDHHHEHEHAEDGIDVFFDMAVDIGLGPEQNETGDMGHPEQQGNEDDEEEEDDDVMPVLEPIRSAPRTTMTEDDDEEMPPLEPITAPLTTPLVGRQGPAQGGPFLFTLIVITHPLVAPNPQPTPSTSQPQPQPEQPAAGPSQPMAAGQPPRPQTERRREFQLPLFNFDIVFSNPIPIVTRTGTQPSPPQEQTDNEADWEDEQVWVVPSQAEAEATTAANTPPQPPTAPTPNAPQPRRGRQHAVNLPGITEIFGPMDIPMMMGGGNGGGNGQTRSASAPPRNPASDNNANNNAGAQQGPGQFTAADLLRQLVGVAQPGNNQAGGPGRVGLGATLGTHGRDANANPASPPANANANANNPPTPDMNGNPVFDIMSMLARLIAVTPVQGQRGGQAPQQPQQQQGQRPPTPAFVFRNQQGQQQQAQPQQPQQPRQPFMFGRPPSSRSSTPRKEWSLPSPPGLTLRQRVERAEKEAGLRCDDVSCGIGPSDEEPEIDARVEMISILRRPLSDKGKGRADDLEPACTHKLHPSCLVSAERVAWSSRNEEEEKEVDGKDYIDVECPVCRVEGCVGKEVWMKGAAES